MTTKFRVLNLIMAIDYGNRIGISSQPSDTSSSICHQFVNTIQPKL